MVWRSDAQHQGSFLGCDLAAQVGLGVLGVRVEQHLHVIELRYAAALAAQMALGVLAAVQGAGIQSVQLSILNPEWPWCRS